MTEEESERNALRWDAILADIIFTFEAIRLIDNVELFSPDMQNYKGWTEEWFAEWAAHAEDRKARYNKLLPPSRPMTKEEFERYQRGWALFKEYYFSLWD